jgi:hypothetical protein
MNILTLFLVINVVQYFIPSPKSSVRTSNIHMAGGQVPLVPYYPNKATGYKDYPVPALGRDRTLFVGRLL